jgi:hypothetical protein
MLTIFIWKYIYIQSAFFSLFAPPDHAPFHRPIELGFEADKAVADLGQALALPTLERRKRRRWRRKRVAPRHGLGWKFEQKVSNQHPHFGWAKRRPAQIGQSKGCQRHGLTMIGRHHCPKDIGPHGYGHGSRHCVRLEEWI